VFGTYRPNAANTNFAPSCWPKYSSSFAAPADKRVLDEPGSKGASLGATVATRVTRILLPGTTSFRKAGRHWLLHRAPAP